MTSARVLIVGGGVAGMGCAHELMKLGIQDFLVVSENIGGRAPDVNAVPPRATFYTRGESEDFSAFVKLGRRADVWKGRLVTKDRIWSPFWIFLRHPVACARFYFLVRKFDSHYTAFIEKSGIVSQKAAIESDPYLEDLFKQDAIEYLREKGLSAIAQELVGTLVRVTGFVRIEEASAFLMFWIWLILVKKGRECSVDFRALSEPFLGRVIQDKVVSVSKNGSEWIVGTAQGKSITCDVLVMATPISVTEQLLNMDLPDRRSIAVYSSVVRGKVLARYGTGRYNVLPANEKDVVIVRNDDGTFLFCSTQKNYDLSRYFELFEVLETRDWDPAGFYGKELIESKRSDDLYMIGDYHIPSLESAFVTGLQAARAIVATTARSN